MQMHTLEQQLSKYAAYHRDRRNIATHFVGIPLIVLGVLILTARLNTIGATPPPSHLLDFSSTVQLLGNVGVLVLILSSVYYLALDLALGFAMLAWHTLLLAIAIPIAGLAAGTWLAMGVGSFVVGWVLQFIGHHYEGRKPAFVDDLMGLVTGPLFVMAELIFMLGLRKPLLAVIEAKVGPTHSGARAPTAQ